MQCLKKIIDHKDDKTCFYHLFSLKRFSDDTKLIRYLTNMVIKMNQELYEKWIKLMHTNHMVWRKKFSDKNGIQGQGRILRILAKNNDNLSQKELAAKAEVRPASLSEVLERLERAKLITRQRDHKDKRILRVSLTDAGEKIVKENGQQWAEFNRTLLGDLDEQEQKELLHLTDKLQQTIDEYLKG